MPERQVYTSVPFRLEQPPASPPRDPEARIARERDSAVNERNTQKLGPVIAAYLDSYQAAISELALGHEIVGNDMAFDLVGDTPQSATWLLTGHGISMAHAALGLLRQGYGMEAAPLMRALHETNRLLSAVMHADDLLAAWLRDRGQLRFKDVQRAVEGWEQMMREQMIRDGEAPPASTKTHADRTYALLSDYVHGRRASLVDRVSVPGRYMPIGPHPDVRVRAAVVSEFGIFLANLLTVGGSAIARFLGREWFDRYQGTLAVLLELRRKADISPEALRSKGDASSTAD